jgi:hypothetical protein
MSSEDTPTPRMPWYSALFIRSRLLYSRLRTIRNKFALVALFFGIAANLVSIAGHIETVKIFLLKNFGIQYPVFWHLIGAFIISLILLISYSILALWLFNKSVSVKGHILVGTAALCLFVVNIAIAIPRQPEMEPLIKDIRDNMTRAVLLQQNDQQSGEDSGGFRFALSDGPQDAQAWTTAQIVYALETLPLMSPEARVAVRQGLDYIERMRVTASNRPCQEPNGQQDGWAYIKFLPWGVTEVNSWVLLSKITSLQSRFSFEIWDPSELTAELQRTKLDVEALARRQHDDGGWAPIAKTEDATHLRTYSTIMALWSLLEAKRNDRLGPMLGSSYDPKITHGARWLLTTWSGEKGGWGPNPAWKQKEKLYPGLTAQALYVLQLVAKYDPHIARDDDLRKVKENFIRWATGEADSNDSLRARAISQNESPHDSDRYLHNQPYTIEQTTFLWYPWTLAALSEMAHDDLSSKELRDASNNLFHISLSRVANYWKFTTSDPVAYPIAEGLIGLNIANHLAVKK